VNINYLFQGIANNLLNEFDLIHEQISHSGERGRVREHAFQLFLGNHLPGKYSLGSGIVVDKQGNQSHQCDIVIYDSFTCSRLFSKSNIQIFPIECVLGVIEVKSILGSNQIRDAALNIQAVKKLHRNQPVVGCLFAYRSRFKLEPKIEQSAVALQRVNSKIAPSERLDLMCVLSDGLVLGHKGPPDWGTDDDELMVFLETVPHLLVLFLFYLTEFISERQVNPPALVSYATQGEIGLVRSMPAASPKQHN